MCTIEDYQCPRCLKSKGYYFLDKLGASYFCAEPECLQDDCSYAKINLSEQKVYNSFEKEDASATFTIGKEYRNASLSRWKAPKVQHENVSLWLKNPINMLVLIGTPGTGKTYFCTAIANYFIDFGKEVKYFNARRYFEEIQKSIASNQSQYEACRRVAEAEFLILDDIGASTNTEWQKEMLLEVIDLRYSNQKPTIITSNLDEKTMKETLGERTSRRVFAEKNHVLVVTKC